MRWRETRDTLGRVTGIASANALTNLINSGVITREYIEQMVADMANKKDSEAS